MAPTAGCAESGCDSCSPPEGQPDRPELMKLSKFDSEFRNGLGYHQPAGALASMESWRLPQVPHNPSMWRVEKTPVYIAENCTQCMECITACPDTALPNTAQDISTILERAAHSYVSSPEDRVALIKAIPQIDERSRAIMVEAVASKEKKPFCEIVRAQVSELEGISDQAKEEFCGIIEQLPLAYSDVTAIFRLWRRRAPATGDSSPSLFLISAKDVVSAFKFAGTMMRCG